MSARVASAVAASLALAACTTSGLAFRVDERIDIVRPGDRERVTLPVELAWTVRDFDVGPDVGLGNYFAVFVDRAPLPRGAHLDSLADEACKSTAGCPDARWLAERNVHLTAGTSVRLETLPDRRSGDRVGARDAHEAVIVLMDASGRRIGESQFTVTFFVDRTRPDPGGGA